MIKDAQRTYLAMVNKTAPSITLEWIKPDDDTKGPTLNLKTNEPLYVSDTPATGMLAGLAVIGYVPNTLYETEQLQRDWFVIKSNARLHEIYLDPWPDMGRMIVAIIEGRREPVEGFVCDSVSYLHMSDDGDSIRHQYVFMELDRENSFPIYGTIPTISKRGQQDSEPKSFIPVDFTKLIAWAYLDDNGQMFRMKSVFESTRMELFADCEFDDETKELISVGIVSTTGKCWYAFDSEAASRTKNPWIQEHVNSVLLEVPVWASVTDLVSKRLSWQEWLKQFWNEHMNAPVFGKTADVIIHTDFSTDVEYLSRLFHLGEGHRIGSGRRINFQIDYVDPYPTTLKGAVQHNAMWDAIVLYHHLGFTQQQLMRELVNNSDRIGQIQEKLSTLPSLMTPMGHLTILSSQYAKENQTPRSAWVPPHHRLKQPNVIGAGLKEDDK